MNPRPVALLAAALACKLLVAAPAETPTVQAPASAPVSTPTPTPTPPPESTRRDATVTLVTPSGAAVPWRGIPADEAAAPPGAPVMYPAPDAASALAAVLGHALFMQGMLKVQRDARQVAADKVLEPHAAALAAMTPRTLAAATMARLSAAGPVELVDRAREAVDGWVVETQPRFAMAADSRAIVLDNALKVYRSGQAIGQQIPVVVRVVSAPRQPGQTGSDTGGPSLMDDSAAMLAHSIEIALSPAASASGPARTQRYWLGETERMERGQVLATSCSRVLLRTLRDWLMSVPVRPAGNSGSCADSYQFDRPAP